VIAIDRFRRSRSTGFGDRDRVNFATMAHKNLLVKKIAALQSCGRSDALPLPRLRSAPIVTAAQYFAAPDA
jgi:hypothetical protein